MKKVYLACLSLLSVAAFGQQNTGTIEYAPAQPGDVQGSRPAVLGEDRAPDDIIWSHDFTTASDWTAAGGDANNGWSIGTTTNGWYFGTGGNMGTSGEFARLEVEQPSTITSGPLTFTYNNSIDLSGVPAPHLEWEQFGARFITLQEVQVSTDGGTNWITAGSNADIEPLTLGGGSVYGQPETRRFNISQAISGDPSNVMIRLFWDGDMNGGNINYVDYGWFVDDIRIVEGHAYDMQNDNAYFVSGTELLEYYLIPTSQTTDIEFSGEATNVGGSIFDGAYLEVNVDMGGNVFTGTSTPTVDINPNASDSLVVSTTYVPGGGMGTYDITWDFLGNNADTYNSNDQLTDQIEVTEYTYSRDNGNQTGSISNIVGNTGSPMGIGNVMEIFGNGVIGAIDIYIADGNPADLIYGRIDLYDAGSQEFIWQGQSQDYSLQNGDIDDWVRLVFDQPITVNAGDIILLTANHYGSDVNFGYAQSTFDGTVLGYDGGAALFGLASPSAIMIRADMRDFTSVDEEINNFEISQNFPNPFDNTSIISYTLTEGADVTVTFTDVSGKVIKTINQGTQGAGTYQIEISADEFAAGSYFYTFTIGDTQVTKKMTIQK